MPLHAYECADCDIEIEELRPAVYATSWCGLQLLCVTTALRTEGGDDAEYMGMCWFFGSH